MLTVAVTVWPARPVVSTLMVLVPWPLEIVPAETDQLYVNERPESLLTDAVNVIA